MSFFRRPGEDSSSEEDSSADEQEVEIDVSQSSAKESNGTTEDATQNDTTESLSLARTISNGENGAPTSVDEARDLITASLLEELAKYRAAEELNKNGGSHVAKDSPEVQRLAREIFTKSSGVLAEVGVISPDSASEHKKLERARYLNSLERVSYTGIGNMTTDQPANLQSTHGILVRRTSQQPTSWQTLQNVHFQQSPWHLDTMIRRPSVELPIMPLNAPLRFNSHYRSSFIERGILGKGGFGKVFHSYNLYDQREYAIKKIPLSPKLAQNYTQGGLPALKHILKEVQALAKLEHCNIVRYHATWIEEPNLPAHDEDYHPTYPAVPHRGQRLLDNAPANSSAPSASKQVPIVSIYESKAMPAIGRVVPATSADLEQDDSDPFARSRGDESDGKLLWSQQKATTVSASQADETDPFSDGRSHRRESLIRSTILNDQMSKFYVLHVQMSMYPLTLAEYLLPVSSPRRRVGTQKARHCFHVIPALRLLLGILCGLQYIHSHGYIHRDIKPGNIFLSQVDMITPNVFNLEQGYIDVGSCPSCVHHEPRFLNPRIGDFGLVAELERAVLTEDIPGARDELSSSQSAVGTQFYRPPQQGQKSISPDEKLDVFALGVVLLELLYYCSTSTGRQIILRGCQDGAIPDDFDEIIVVQGYGKNIVNALRHCLGGMLDLNPRTRWRCAMVKSTIEEILSEISLQRSNIDPG